MKNPKVIIAVVFIISALAFSCNSIEKSNNCSRDSYSSDVTVNYAAYNILVKQISEEWYNSSDFCISIYFEYLDTLWYKKNVSVNYMHDFPVSELDTFLETILEDSNFIIYIEDRRLKEKMRFDYEYGNKGFFIRIHKLSRKERARYSSS